MPFKNRTDAGRQLAQALKPYAQEDCLVLGLPRGGVPVAFEVARALQKPMDVMVVRKVGAPGYEELAVGAVGPENVLILNRGLIGSLGLSEELLEGRISREIAELRRRLRHFRGDRPFPDLKGRTVILVDDGLATGATARAAVHASRRLGAGRIVLAVPVGAESTVSHLKQEVDDLVCLETPAEFEAVSLWYQEFPQTTDTQVIDLLERAWGRPVEESSLAGKTITPP